MNETSGRTLTVAWQDPMVGAKAAEGMSGLEFWKAMQKGEVPLPPICELVGFGHRGEANRKSRDAVPWRGVRGRPA